MRDTVETVLGPVPVDNLGFTLCHEHVLDGGAGVRATYPELMDWNGILAEGVRQLSEAKSEGLQTILDATTFEMGRDVPLLQEVSKQSGVHIVASTGTYLDIPRLIWYTHPDRIAALYVREIAEGIDGLGVRAGMIKVANDNHELSAPEVMILRAASRASNQTGAPITTHTQPLDRVGDSQLKVFLDEGVDPKRICIGHSSDATDYDYLAGLARQGVFLGMDEFPGHIPDAPWREKAKMVTRLLNAGFGAQLMLSHDWSIKMPPDDSWGSTAEQQHRVNPDGYAFVARNLLPLLREQGASEEEIRQMTVDNPRRFLAGA